MNRNPDRSFLMLVIAIALAAGLIRMNEAWFLESGPYLEERALSFLLAGRG